MKHNLCPYCGVRMSATYQSRWARTRDHIIPQSRGGREWVHVCRSCNLSKGALTLNEWRAALSVQRRRIHVFAFEKLIPRAILYSVAPILTRLSLI